MRWMWMYKSQIYKYSSLLVDYKVEYSNNVFDSQGELYIKSV